MVRAGRLTLNVLAVFLLALSVRSGAAMRVLLVTGANKGIGLAIAKNALRAADDTHVILASRSLERGDEARAKIIAELGAAVRERIETLELDVGDAASVLRARDQVAARHAELYAMVNNAGVALDMPWCPKPFAPSVARETLATNFQGAVNCCEAFVPLLRKAGRVVNVSSGGGLMNTQRMSAEKRAWLLREDLTLEELQGAVQEFTGEYEAGASKADAGGGGETGGQDLPRQSKQGWWLHAYGFSKAALNAYTRVLSRMHPEILANVCSPGFILTDMTANYADAATLKTADEGSCATTPLWLALDDISGVSGRYFGDGCKEINMDGSGDAPPVPRT